MSIMKSRKIRTYERGKGVECFIKIVPDLDEDPVPGPCAGPRCPVAPGNSPYQMYTGYRLTENGATSYRPRDDRYTRLAVRCPAGTFVAGFKTLNGCNSSGQASYVSNSAANEVTCVQFTGFEAQACLQTGHKTGLRCSVKCCRIR